jgi:hypothetical protein
VFNQEWHAEVVLLVNWALRRREKILGSNTLNTRNSQKASVAAERWAHKAATMRGQAARVVLRVQGR